MYLPDAQGKSPIPAQEPEAKAPVSRIMEGEALSKRRTA